MARTITLSPIYGADGEAESLWPHDIPVDLQQLLLDHMRAQMTLVDAVHPLVWRPPARWTRRQLADYHRLHRTAIDAQRLLQTAVGERFARHLQARLEADMAGVRLR